MDARVGECETDQRDRGACESLQESAQCGRGACEASRDRESPQRRPCDSPPRVHGVNESPDRDRVACECSQCDRGALESSQRDRGAFEASQRDRGAFESSQRDLGAFESPQSDRGICICHGGVGLEVLKDVQRAYEDRLEVIEKVGGKNKLQMQSAVLRSWVGDLVAQNALLVRAVTALEAEAAARLRRERARHREAAAELRWEAGALRRRLARKDSDVRALIEVLRRLREFDYCSLDGIHFFEVTESDIFGKVQWCHKLDQGDIKRPERRDCHRPRSKRQ